MAEETDGIEEAFEGQLRVLVTAAGQVGERVARIREETLRRAQAASEREARELRSRLEAEQRAARVELGNVYRADWWDRSTPEQIANTYQLARAWSPEDPEAGRAEQRIRDELRTRYGVDVTAIDAHAVRNAVERGEESRRGHDGNRQRSASEEAEAAQLMAAADDADRAEEHRRVAAVESAPLIDERIAAASERLEDIKERFRHQSLGKTTQGQHDRTAAAQRQALAELDELLAEKERSGANNAVAQEDTAPRYDSAQRRVATARDLEAQGIAPDAVATKIRADISQATPATEATAAAGARAPKARKRRSRGAQIHRTGLQR